MPPNAPEVVLPDILHTGDTWWNGIYPFMDYSTGGSIDGMIRAVEASRHRMLRLPRS